jgi:type II secretory pathway component PulF
MTTAVLDANEDAHEFAVRQFSAEFEAGASAAVAAERLRTVLPKNFHWAVAEIEGAFTGGAGPREQPQLASVLKLAANAGARPEKAFAAYARSARRTRPRTNAALSGAMVFGAYILGLVVILAIVVGIYVAFILPQMEAIFGGFGVPLPAFTEFLIGTTWMLIPLFLLLLLGLVFYFVGLRRLERRLVTMQPVRELLRWLPGLSGWARQYDTFLWMRYQAVFLDAGLNHPSAHDAASRLAGEPLPGDTQVALLNSAAQLGRLREELDAQLANEDAISLTRFERQRNAFSIFVRVFIYFLVSAYVVAMYLPIFKLGAVV